MFNKAQSIYKVHDISIAVNMKNKVGKAFDVKKSLDVLLV